MIEVTNGGNVKIIRGDTGVLELSIEDAQGQSYDFSGDTVILTVKKSSWDKDAVIQKTFNSDKQVVFEVEDTKNLAFGDYVFDVQLTHTEGEGTEAITTVDTVIPVHKFTVGQEVSW